MATGRLAPRLAEHRAEADCCTAAGISADHLTSTHNTPRAPAEANQAISHPLSFPDVSFSPFFCFCNPRIPRQKMFDTIRRGVELRQELWLYEFSSTHHEQTPIVFGEWEPSWDAAPNALGSDMASDHE